MPSSQPPSSSSFSGFVQKIPDCAHIFIHFLSEKMQEKGLCAGVGMHLQPIYRRAGVSNLVSSSFMRIPNTGINIQSVLIWKAPFYTES